MERCLISLKKKSIVDYLRDNGRTCCENKTIDEIREIYPDVQEMTTAAAFKTLESCFVDKVIKEITKDQFMEAFEVLPPKFWRKEVNSESFMSLEHSYGSVTQIYVRVKGAYYKFKDVCTLSHKEILTKLADCLAEDMVEFMVRPS